MLQLCLNNDQILCHPSFLFLHIAFFVLSLHSFFITNIVCLNTVSLPLASFLCAGHFLLDVFLECLVEVVPIFLLASKDFSGKFVEGLEALVFRPSTCHQVAACTTSIVSKLVALGSLGESRRLWLIMTWAKFGYNPKSQYLINVTYRDLYIIFPWFFFLLSFPGCAVVDNAKVNESFICYSK